MNLLGLSPIMIWLWLRLAFQPESFRLDWQNLDVGNVTWAVQVVQSIVACGCSMLLRIIKDAWGGKPLGPKRLSLFSQLITSSAGKMCVLWWSSRFITRATPPCDPRNGPNMMPNSQLATSELCSCAMPPSQTDQTSTAASFGPAFCGHWCIIHHMDSYGAELR